MVREKRNLTDCAYLGMKLSSSLMRVVNEMQKGDPEQIRVAINGALEAIGELKKNLPGIADRLIEIREEALEQIIKSKGD